jgi:hypothetical protein
MTMTYSDKIAQDTVNHMHYERGRASRDAEVAALKAEVERLRDVLAWYGNNRNWRTNTVYMCGHIGETKASLDAGERARAAITEKEKP